MNQLPTFFTNVQERRVCRRKNRKLTFLFKHAEIGEHIGHQHYNLFRQYFHQSLLSKDPFSQACMENEQPRNRNACTCYDVYWSIAFNWFFLFINLRWYSPTIFWNVLCLILHVFLYLEAFQVLNVTQLLTG